MSLNPDFIAELRKRFTGDIRLDLGSRVLYSTDASIYQIEPLGVVIPRTQDDLHRVVELAAKYKVPILPRGSGSSLAGQAIGEALILDCSRWLDQIVDINPESKTAMVEPGVILSTLNRAAAKFGLQFGPDPASAERATMGGIIGNNATGAHSILYGMTADHLLSADAILSDGSLATLDNSLFDTRNSDSESRMSNIVSTALNIREKYAEAIKQHYPKSWRNSAGYRLNYLLPWSPSKPPQWVGETYPPSQNGKINLAALLAGSEGTLAVIRRATVNLVSKPKYTILGILAYNSNAEACDAVPSLLDHHPSAIELIPQMILRLARGIPAYARQMDWVNGDPAAVLVVEFSGDRPEVLKDAVQHLRDDVVIAESSEEQARVWNIRKVGLGILDSRQQPARSTTFIEDCAIPVERLGGFVREIEKILFEHQTEGGIYAHASAGCLHIRPILNLKTSSGVHDLREIAEQTLALTLRLGGAMASEHGDGIARGEWLKQTYGDELLAAMHTLKHAADPNGLLNPGKLFDTPPMDSHLRYGTNYQARAWTTSLHFAHADGLAGAIEQCNGQGVCRKDTGVMCPSFQATREEQNSTRGRANLLRAMISRPRTADSGRSMVNGPQSEIEVAVANALDLCLACKGCKAECPSGVDMAKLKFAFLDEYYKSHGRPLRDYVFGYFHITAKLLSTIAPIANFVSGISFARHVLARLSGIAPERPFPKFSTRRANAKMISASSSTVLFLPDPYSHYIEPQVEQAAFDLLFELGFDVKVLPVIGAGAALFSKGFLKVARQRAEKVLNAINRFDPDGVLPIVGIEPPEIYMLKNDYADLLPEYAEELSQHKSRIWLLDEFLIRSDKFSNLKLSASAKKIKFHPHCHQRAEGPSDDGLPNGLKATIELLRACGFVVEQTDAGCCGMAGTFGYEAEHYELSQKIGGLKLFPQVNQRGDAIVVSTGTACRMQIAQGTGVVAEHPVVVVERELRVAMKSQHHKDT